MNKLQFFKSLKTIENTELYSLRSFAEAAKQIDSKLTYRTIRARLRSPKLAHLFTTVGKDIGFEPRALVVVVSIALKDAMQVIDVNATGAASMAVDAANSTLKQCLLETRALSSGSAVIANNVHTFPLRHLIPATNNMAQVNNAAVKLSTKSEPTEPNEAEATEAEATEEKWVTQMNFLTNLDETLYTWVDQPKEGEQEIAFVRNIFSQFYSVGAHDRRLTYGFLMRAFNCFMKTRWDTMPQEWKVQVQDLPKPVSGFFYGWDLEDVMALGPVKTKYLFEVCQLAIETLKATHKAVQDPFMALIDDALVAQLMEEAKVLARAKADKEEVKAAEVESKEQIEAQAVKSLHPVTAAYSADKQTKAMIEERVDFVSWQPYMLEGRLLATTNGLVRVDNVIDNMAMFYIANELDLTEAKHAVLKSEQFKRWTGCVATEFVAISASSLPNFTAALVHEMEAKGKRINYVALTTFMQEVLTAATCCITGEYYRLSANEVIDACTNFSVQGCSPMALTRRDELVNKFMVQWEDGRKLFPNDVQDLQQCLDLIEAAVNAHEVEEEVAKEAEHGVEWSASSGDFGQVPYEEYIDFSIDPREEARLEREMGISDEDKDMGFVYDPEHGVFPFNLVDDNGDPIAHLPGQELNVPSTDQATA